MKTKVYSSADTAHVLRLTLGPLREWSNFLADCRAGKTDCFGHILLPVMRARDDSGYWRPFYRGRDIIKFVNAVRAACPVAKPNQHPRPYEVDLDLSDGCHWRDRKASLRVGR